MPVTTTEACLSYQLLGRYCQKFILKMGIIPESQSGFRKDRGTIAMNFKARQPQQNVDLYMTFVDLAKAFDTVSRGGL